MKAEELEREPGSPVAVGGVGGSGTRVIADILRELGFHIGSDLNKARDNLWFTLLFKRLEVLTLPDKEFGRLVRIFVNGMTKHRQFSPEERLLIHHLASCDRMDHSSEWLRERERSLVGSHAAETTARTRWGWKEPNTHFIIDRLLETLPAMRYVHVSRNGLDMAYSPNQNQLRFWGPSISGPSMGPITPRQSLKFWCEAERRIRRLSSSPFSGRVFLLSYDGLCAQPRKSLQALVRFLGHHLPEGQLQRLGDLVVAGRVGRHREGKVGDFDEPDVAFVKELGFEVLF